MTTKQPLLVSAIVMLICFAQEANARIWRVNNRSDFNGTTLFGGTLGGINTYPVFKEINQAVAWSSVVNGDTIYVESSPNNYLLAEINKRLDIIGPGFFLNENLKTAITFEEARIERIEFDNNSQGSVCIGITINAVASNSAFIISVSNITIKRCRIPDRISISGGCTGIFILQNFFTRNTNPLLTSSSPGTVEVVFNNNICLRTLIWNGPILQCINNIFDGPQNVLNLQFDCQDFQNNILKATGATVLLNAGNLTGIAHNTGSLPAQFGNANNNIVIANMTSLFVDPVLNSTDGDYQLKPGSAAGSDGQERGAFGGASIASRYTLSGLAPIPVIYDISTSGVADATGLPVTIKARTIK